MDGTVDCEVLGNYTLPVSDFCETPVCKKVIKLKNGYGEMRNRSCSQYIIRFYKVLKLKSVEHLKNIWNMWNISSKYKEVGNAGVEIMKFLVLEFL